MPVMSRREESTQIARKQGHHRRTARTLNEFVATQNRGRFEKRNTNAPAWGDGGVFRRPKPW